MLDKQCLSMNYSAICSAGAAEGLGFCVLRWARRNLVCCCRHFHDDGTPGQIERRVARILRGAGRAGVSRSADLSRAVLRKKIRCGANYESSSGAASAALERGADYASGGEAAVCLDGWFGKVFV